MLRPKHMGGLAFFLPATQASFPWPLPNNEFDEIICRHVIEHVPDVMSFVSELHRVTKPAGLITIVTPHYTNPDWPTDPAHCNHFNGNNILDSYDGFL
jgi:2-polyprenyl-3-methyl-5-hydroxy-6-metoxy-1,4-benzoquinol methylase